MKTARQIYFKDGQMIEEPISEKLIAHRKALQRQVMTGKPELGFTPITSYEELVNITATAIIRTDIRTDVEEEMTGKQADFLKRCMFMMFLTKNNQNAALEMADERKFRLDVDKTVTALLNDGTF